MLAITNVSNPAAFGAQWTIGGSNYQLVNLRGTASLLFGMRASDGDWTTTPVAAPERFMTTAPRTYAEFRRAVEQFVTDGTADD